MLSYGVYTGIIMVLMMGIGVLFEKPQRYMGSNRIKDYKKQLLESPIKVYLSRTLGAWRRSRRSQIMDREIYEAISFLRNIISIDRGKQVSTDFIIEQLSDREGPLQGTYIKMLSLLRVNRRKEAQAVMGMDLDSSIGKEFSSLLFKWDEIDPGELSEILLSYQKSIKEIRMTQQRRRDEAISDLLYFPVIINVVLIFINFIYVGYFIDQKEVLQMLF